MFKVCDRLVLRSVPFIQAELKKPQKAKGRRPQRQGTLEWTTAWAINQFKNDAFHMAQRHNKLDFQGLRSMLGTPHAPCPPEADWTTHSLSTPHHEVSIPGSVAEPSRPPKPQIHIL